MAESAKLEGGNLSLGPGQPIFCVKYCYMWDAKDSPKGRILHSQTKIIDLSTSYLSLDGIPTCGVMVVSLTFHYFTCSIPGTLHIILRRDDSFVYLVWVNSVAGIICGCNFIINKDVLTTSDFVQLHTIHYVRISAIDVQRGQRVPECNKSIG